VARRSVLGDRWPAVIVLALAVSSDTGIARRDAVWRASRAPTIAMTAAVRISSSGSPGKLAAIRG